MKLNAAPYICLAAILCLSSCGLFHKKKKVEPKPDLVIGYIPSSDMFPYHLALLHGYYDSLQVHVRFRRMESRAQRDSLYRKGKLDGCAIDLADAIGLSAQGNPIHPVMANEGCFYLLATPDSTVRHLDGLKEKSVGVNPYSATEYLTDVITRRFGYLDDDVNKPEIANDYYRLQMLLNNQIDAGMFGEPYSTEAVKKGAIKLYSCNELNRVTTVTAFRSTALQKKREAIKKLIEGYNKAVAYINVHPVREWYREVADSIGITPYKPPFKIAPFHQARAIPQSDIDSTTQWMKRYQLVPPRYKADIVDYTFIAKPQAKPTTHNHKTKAK